MERHLSNWLRAYTELMENTEPAAIFDKWVGYSVIAGALRRKIKLELGRLEYYPNIYVVLVAEPGVARKTQAIKFGVDLLSTVPDIKTSADSATKEAMTDDIEEAGLDERLVSGETLRHSSLNIISKEFETFLGQKKENTRMLTALTDLYDNPDDWSARTRHGKSNKIIRPWINLLAATTPDSLASSLPATAIGGGLTSRILFVWADKKKKSVAIPDMTDEERKLKDLLIRDLYQVSRMSGNYTMSPDCLRRWTEWYDNYDEDESGIRICTDKSFSGWYSRKPTTIIKVAMLNAAAETNKLEIQWRNIEAAIEDIKVVEFAMGNAFKAIGKSEITAEVDTVTKLIHQHNWISEKRLMSLVWRDIDANKFDNVINTVLLSGKAVREYKGPNNEKGIWYRARTFAPLQ